MLIRRIVVAATVLLVFGASLSYVRVEGRRNSNIDKEEAISYTTATEESYAIEKTKAELISTTGTTDTGIRSAVVQEDDRVIEVPTETKEGYYNSRTNMMTLDRVLDTTVPIKRKEGKYAVTYLEFMVYEGNTGKRVNSADLYVHHCVLIEVSAETPSWMSQRVIALDGNDLVGEQTEPHRLMFEDDYVYEVLDDEYPWAVMIRLEDFRMEKRPVYVELRYHYRELRPSDKIVSREQIGETLARADQLKLYHTINQGHGNAHLLSLKPHLHYGILNATLAVIDPQTSERRVLLEIDGSTLERLRETLASPTYVLHEPLTPTTIIEWSYEMDMDIYYKKKRERDPLMAFAAIWIVYEDKHATHGSFLRLPLTATL